MRQFTTPEQTAKLIELGFKKPPKKGFLFQHNIGNCLSDLMLAEENYSIGELIEMLPKHIEIKSQWCRLDIYPTKNKWHINYDNIGFEGLAKTYETELIDALYNMIVKLKEDRTL